MMYIKHTCVYQTYLSTHIWVGAGKASRLWCTVCDYNVRHTMYIQHICLHLQEWSLAKRAGTGVFATEDILQTILNEVCVLLHCVAVCCSVLQSVAVCFSVCCSVLQCVAVCCSVLQCVAAYCSVLQCVESDKATMSW